MYHVVITSAAQRHLDKLERSIQLRILVRIRGLVDTPRPTGVQKLEGQDAYRIRVGDYRILYTIADEEPIVWIIRVAHRREVYR